MINKWSPGCNCVCGECCFQNKVADGKSEIEVDESWLDIGTLASQNGSRIDCEFGPHTPATSVWPAADSPTGNPVSMAGPGCFRSASIYATLPSYNDGTDPHGYVIEDECDSGTYRSVSIISENWQSADPTQSHRYYTRGASVEYMCDEHGEYDRKFTIAATYLLSFFRTAPGGTKRPWAEPYYPNFTDGVDYTWVTDFAGGGTATHTDGRKIIVTATSGTILGFSVGVYYITAIAEVYGFSTNSLTLWNGAYDPLGLLTGTATLNV